MKPIVSLASAIAPGTNNRLKLALADSMQLQPQKTSDLKELIICTP